MIKKTCLTFALTALYSVAFGGSVEQLTHIQTEIKKTIADYQKTVVTIKVLTKKMPADIATTTTSAIDKLIGSEKFQKTLNEAADSQCENILNFKNVDYKPSIANYSSGKYTPAFTTLFNATAKKAFRQLLWNKLKRKEKELMAELNSKETSKETASIK